MTATQKSRTPWNEPNRAFEDKTLLESGNETQIVQKIDLEMGGHPDPQNTGDFKADVLLYDLATRTLIVGNAIEGAKFKAGDEVVLYSEDDKSRLKFQKNCVKEVNDDEIVLFADFTDIPGDVTIEKNLVFRGSNRNCYRQDKYGVKRFYPATAGVSGIEASMGEMFEYKWDRSDYTFTMDNYDHRFDPYQPGGQYYSTFALRDVNVYFGFGEESYKNRLVFQGVTNLNNGVSEDDEKLSITAYDISYLYNIPVNLNTFPTTILDSDYQGEPIPILFGDYTTIGAMVNGFMRPSIPAILTKVISTLQYSKMMINVSDLGTSSSMKIEAKATGTAADGYELELVYSNETVSGLLPSVATSATVGGKTRFTVNLYRGKAADKTLYNSTKWIKQCLLTNSTFTTNFTFTGEVNEPLKEYKNNTVPTMNNYYIKTVVYKTTGGATTRQAYFKISANGLNTNQTNFKFWCNKGTWDKFEDWDTTHSTFANLAVTNTIWNSSTGELIFTVHTSLTDADIQKYKVYAFVAGPSLNNSTIRTDDKLLLNVAHSSDSPSSIVDFDRSGNGAYSVYVGARQAYFGGGFPLGGYRKITPYTVIKTPAVPRECKNTFGIVHSCTGGDPAKYDYKFSYPVWFFNRVESIGTQDFAFEIEFQKEFNTDNLTPNVTIPGTIPYLFAMGYQESLKSDPWILGFFNPMDQFTFNFYGSSIICDYTFANNKVYGLKITKTGNVARIYIKSITDSETYAEATYVLQQTLPAVVQTVNYISYGSKTIKASAAGGTFYGKIGMTRFRVGANAFLDDDFLIYGQAGVEDDIVSIARRIIQFSGADETMFDTTWDNYTKDKVNTAYQARTYIVDQDLKTIDYAVELLGQIGIVLTMREDNGKMKFSLIWDSVEHYEKGMKKITAYDVEFGSVNIERELNQYFNTAKAEYNYNPALDELSYQSGNYFEPAAVERDGNLNVWFKREDKGWGSFEFPSLYTINDCIAALKQIIANSTPNTEMITLNLSWRHLMLQVGEFVIFNYGRYKNIPMQVRSVNLDANGSSIEVKLRSMENLNFIDVNTGVEYVPAVFDGVGGLQSLTNITNLTDVGDE